MSPSLLVDILDLAGQWAIAGLFFDAKKRVAYHQSAWPVREVNERWGPEQERPLCL